ncbi:MAG: polyphosphate polymerase domain-containing protein [Muricomes sp.]|uniref:polyphosphate polymerase domain-containing protein n=1 Tax=Faecalicatena contorta TaxID=39482 RepID=UPI002EBC72E7|nr:polyphosphate polymerase domain-containing protein [Muricomes sp.]
MTIKEKPLMNLRHEVKHGINPLDDQEVSQRLRKLFRHDENAGSHGIYRVSSLYFDTPYDKALRQKIDGVNYREKFRLRYYNDNTSFIRLEKKLKINGLCAKFSERVTYPQAEQLIEGSIDFLLKSEKPLLLELYSKMRGQQLAPKTIVTYDREAFLYDPGNVRITVDRNLRTGLDQIDFLNPQLYYTDVLDNQAVLEVKYDAFLPDIVRLAVQIPNRRAAAYSKYAICRRYD